MKPANINTLETVITAYTNGSCQDRSGKGGWGVYAIANDGTVYEYSGKELNTTSQRMELHAGIMAITNLPDHSQIQITSNSEYLVNGVNLWLADWKKNDWQTASKKPVANKDLWERLDTLNQQGFVSWDWGKGNTKSYGPKTAYALARGAMRKAA